jgi:plastocyanin
MKVKMAVSILFFLPSLVWAGTIHGKVYLSEGLMPHVLVSVAGTEGMSHSVATVHLDHTEGMFVPHVLPIEVGSTVEFRGRDGMPCRLYSASEKNAFNLMRQSGTKRSLTFDRPGVIMVRCQDHPDAVAYIVVTETPYFAVTGESGQYLIEGIPEGERTIQLWFEGSVLEEQRVTIGQGSISLDFHIDRPYKRPAWVVESAPQGQE